MRAPQHVAASYFLPQGRMASELVDLLRAASATCANQWSPTRFFFGPSLHHEDTMPLACATNLQDLHMKLQRFISKCLSSHLQLKWYQEPLSPCQSFHRRLQRTLSLRCLSEGVFNGSVLCTSPGITPCLKAARAMRAGPRPPCKGRVHGPWPCKHLEPGP